MAYKIYKISDCSPVDYAAEELKKYLRMMMPRCGEITIERKLDATTDFRLGLMQDFGLDVSEAEDLDLDDIIHIDTDAAGGIIAGKMAVLAEGDAILLGIEKAAAIGAVNTVVKKDAVIKHVIADKYVTINEGRVLTGHEHYPMVLGRGSEV